MSLFVLSYARQDGEPLIRKFFDRLCVDVSIMHPTVKDVGFMDTQGISTGAIWQETLGGQLQAAQVLVPVFSPSFFASEACGREVWAFLERVRTHGNGNPSSLTPTCILPVVWLWENLTIHESVRDIHYDNVNYPPRYREKKIGLRLLVDLSKNRDQFKTLTNHLAISINRALQTAAAGSRLPTGSTDYRTLPSAFASVNAAASVSGPKAVQFAYVAPTRAEVGALRQNSTYGHHAREWRAFDPNCALGIGHLSESVAAELKMAYDSLPLDDKFPAGLREVERASAQTVFIIDGWAARVPQYEAIFAEVDKDQYAGIPAFFPLNEKDEENRRYRADLRELLAKRLPRRAATEGAAFASWIPDDVDYQGRLARALASGQIARIEAARTPVAAPTQLPTI